MKVVNKFIWLFVNRGSTFFLVQTPTCSSWQLRSHRSNLSTYTALKQHNCESLGRDYIINRLPCVRVNYKQGAAWHGSSTLRKRHHPPTSHARVRILYLESRLETLTNEALSFSFSTIYWPARNNAVKYALNFFSALMHIRESDLCAGGPVRW